MPEQQELRTKLWTKSFIALTFSALFLFMNLFYDCFSDAEG